MENHENQQPAAISSSSTASEQKISVKRHKPSEVKRLSFDEKVKILELLDSGMSQKKISEMFNRSQVAISKIKSNKDKILRERSILKDRNMSLERRRFSNVIESEVEKNLYKWFIQTRAAGIPISGKLLQESALLFNELCRGPASFVASKGYLHSFQKRYNIKSLTTQGDSLSTDVEVATEFRERVSSLVDNFEYSKDCIYNADETGLMWKVFPSYTLAKERVTDPCGWQGLKDRVTVMVCGNASGTDRLQVLMIGNIKEPRCFKNLNVRSLPVIYDSNKSAAMNKTIFKRWYTDVFLPHIIEKHDGKKCILILDNAPAHPTAQELNEISEICSVIFLPPNVMSMMQPMDQGVIEKLKRLYRQILLRDLLRSQYRTNLQKYIEEMNLYKCVMFLSNAWNNVTESNLQNAWKTIFPESDNLNFVDDNECDALEIMHYIPALQSISRQDAELWMVHDNSDPGWEIFTHEEIASGKQNEQDESTDDDEETEINNTVEELPTNLAAYESFQSVYKWVLSRWDVTDQQLKMLQGLHSLAEEVATREVINILN